jgi:hypothetical protein
MNGFLPEGLMAFLLIAACFSLQTFSIVACALEAYRFQQSYSKTT